MNDPAYADAALFDGTAWRSVAPMREARNWFGAVDHATTDAQTGKEYVYVAGGYCCNRATSCFFSPLSSAERFDVETEAWETVQSLPQLNAANQAAACLATDGSCPGAHTVVSLGGGQASVATLVQQAVDLQPSAWVPASDCPGGACAVGSLCCKDPLAASKSAPGACYKVAACSDLHN